MDVIVDIDGTLADCTHRLHHPRHPAPRSFEKEEEDRARLYGGWGQVAERTHGVSQAHPCRPTQVHRPQG